MNQANSDALASADRPRAAESPISDNAAADSTAAPLPNASAAEAVVSELALVQRPAFIESLPKHPELLRIAVAFCKGNYAEVRRSVPLLVASTDDREVSAAALDLQRRIAPDPLVKYLLLVSALLLLVLVLFAYAHGR